MMALPGCVIRVLIVVGKLKFTAFKLSEATKPLG